MLEVYGAWCWDEKEVGLHLLMSVSPLNGVSVLKAGTSTEGACSTSIVRQ